MVFSPELPFAVAGKTSEVVTMGNSLSISRTDGLGHGDPRRSPSRVYGHTNGGGGATTLHGVCRSAATTCPEDQTSMPTRATGAQNSTCMAVNPAANCETITALFRSVQSRTTAWRATGSHQGTRCQPEDICTEHKLKTQMWLSLARKITQEVVRLCPVTDVLSLIAVSQRRRFPDSQTKGNQVSQATVIYS